MIFKILLVSLSVVFSSSTFAGNHVTCSLTSLKNKSIAATLPLTAVNGNGVESSGQGLNIGTQNHSFAMELTTENSFHRVDVIFYENNHVLDEVGSLSCKFKPSAGTKVICQEPMHFNHKLVAQFVCLNN